MSDIERWALREAALPRPGEVRTPEIRHVAPGDSAFSGEVELVRALDYEGAEAERDRWKALADAALDAVPPDHPDLGVWLVEYTDLGGQ